MAHSNQQEVLKSHHVHDEDGVAHPVKYQHQEYPKTIQHPIRGEMTVVSEEHEKAVVAEVEEPKKKRNSKLKEDAE